MHKKVEFILRKILHFLEGFIAVLTLVVMVGMIGLEIYKMLTVAGYFADIHTYLHNTLTIIYLYVVSVTGYITSYTIREINIVGFQYKRACL